MPNIYYVLGHAYRILSNIEPKVYQKAVDLKLAESKPYYYFNKAFVELSRQKKIEGASEAVLVDILDYIDPNKIPDDVIPTDENRWMWWLGYYHTHDMFLRSMEFDADQAKPMGKESLAEWIIATRESLGMNQVEFAELVGCKQPQLCRWETGETIPRVSSIRRIREAVESWINLKSM